MTISSILFINTPEFLLLMISCSLVIKAFLCALITPRILKVGNLVWPCILLSLILAGSIMGELSWSLKLLRTTFFPEIPYPTVVFVIRIAWAFLVIQYMALGLFLKSLTDKTTQLSLVSKGILLLGSVCSTYYLYLAFFDLKFTNEADRLLALANPELFGNPLEITIMHYGALWVFPILLIPNLISMLQNIRVKKLPKILYQQLSILLKYLLMPYLLSEVLVAIHNNYPNLNSYEHATVGFSVIFSTLIVYYSIRKVMGLRFLNFSPHVQSKHTFNFIDDFKIVLEQLSSATTLQELGQITSSFFKNACNIPVRKSALYIRDQLASKDHGLPKLSPIETTIEEFLSMHSPQVCQYIKQQKILIYDELAFSNFYLDDSIQSQIVNFLENINADIFIPIYEKERIVAYIVVEYNSRPEKLYCNVERDEMLVFANYLGNIINLLNNRNLESLMYQEHELKDEIYKKHQEIHQYKESIRSFLKHTKHKEIGIIFYKSRKFVFANQAAKEMIKINPNMQEGHPITRALKNVARQVQEYKSPQTIFTKDCEGGRFVISGVPNLEQNNVIITISYPDITDMVSKQINLLKDPSKWDYLLYLETTGPGQLINQLIPGSGEQLLDFKIDLLKTALSRKATLLDVAEDDVMPTVQLLHHISMRQQLYVLKLTHKSNPMEYAVKLFGANPIYGFDTTQKPLLERLDNIGTLFIENIELLDLETQQYLAEYIRYGYYRIFKTDQRVASNVRIICSSKQHLQTLTQEQLFCPSLFAELKKMTISMPSLITLSDQELSELAFGFSEQAIAQDDYKSLLELNEKDACKLITQRPASLQELKTKVLNLLANKSKKQNIAQEVQFEPSYQISDPDLIQAARLGKHALKDHKIMTLLWQKFQNQNQIATFLGVNRSSVNRRCKEFNLI